MARKSKEERLIEPEVTVEEVNRVLEIGRLLLSVLTQDELEELQALLGGEPFPFPENNITSEIGNTGVT